MNVARKLSPRGPADPGIEPAGAMRLLPHWPRALPPPVMRGWRTGTERLGPPAGSLRRISDAPASHRSPPNV